MFKKGFTLIELLVVIAIIAILAAILFPVFGQAREKARASACLSNTKQIGTALQLYADDYDETVPFLADNSLNRVQTPALMDTYNGSPISDYGFKIDCSAADGYAVQDCWTWADCIFPYVKNLGIYVCPSGAGSVGNGTNHNRMNKCFGYGYNPCLIYNGGSNGWHMDKATATPLSLSEISNTSEIVFVGDCVQYKSGGWVEGIIGPRFINETVYTKANFVVPMRHNGGMNFTFCDGHAKFFKKGQGPDNNQQDHWGYGLKYWDPKAY